jgi:hypothetical protein
MDTLRMVFAVWCIVCGLVTLGLVAALATIAIGEVSYRAFRLLSRICRLPNSLD